MLKKDCRKFLEINREFIEAYSNIVDEKMILTVTKSKLIELFNIDAIELFYLNSNEYYEHLDNGKRLSAQSKLVNWLETNRNLLSLRSPVDKYVQDDLNDLKIKDYNYIFPLINLNKLLAFAIIKLKNKVDSNTLLFLENIFSLCVLSYDNAKRINIQKFLHNHEKDNSNLNVIRKMVSILAHEIKNPLTSIRSSMQYIAKNSNSPIISELSTDLVCEVDRISEITKKMLNRSNPQVSKLTKLDLKDIIEHVLRVHSNLLKKENIAFNLNILNENNLALVTGDESALIGIFTNLIRNSSDALIGVEKAKIDIDIDYRETGVFVAWIDNGCGIRKENLTKIFEPFFTTKSSGYGLGLAYCRKLLKEMDSDLEVTSNPGRGTRFFFNLNY